MDRVLIILTLIQIHDYGWAVKITLSGPKHIKKGEDILLNCSSDATPYGQTAEFLVNGKTVTSLTRHSKGCYSPQMEKDCNPEFCNCSSDGREYTLKYSTYNNNLTFIFTCLMKFTTDRSFFLNDSIHVEVLDMVGPTIVVEGGFPLTARINSSLTCEVFTKLDNIDLILNCLNMTSKQSRSASSTLIKSDLQVRPEYHGENCTCTAQYKDYKTSTSLLINVSNPLILKMENRRYCNGSTSIRLTCSLTEVARASGFNKWLHTNNGVLIRTMEGISNTTMSVVSIQSCSYQDAGEYTCSAWKDNGSGKSQSNRTTVLTVKDTPVILKTNTYVEPIKVLSVQYYGHDHETSVRWYDLNTELQNSTSYTISNAEHKVVMNIHGKPSVRNGHISNLSLHDSNPGRFTVVLRNEFGETRYTFNSSPSDNVFHIRAIFWVLTGVIVFILTIGVMNGILIKLRTSQIVMVVKDLPRRSNRTPIYYAAPEDENNVHTYNLTDPHYLEIEPANSSIPPEYAEIDDDYLKHFDIQNTINHDYLEVIS